MRIMGLDYGTKTVGVAISDALGLTAQGIETIQRKEENKLRRTLARIEELVREYEVDTIVLGFPKHMNNDVGERAKKSLEFKEMLVRRTGLDVVMWDERLTTVEAERTLIESQVRRENRKQYIDKIAAVFILQGASDPIAPIAIPISALPRTGASLIPSPTNARFAFAGFSARSLSTCSTLSPGSSSL